MQTKTEERRVLGEESLHFSAPALALLDRFKQAGYRAWLVGGAVRDGLLGIPNHDEDITTDALPEEIEALFSDCKTLDVGKAFGTVRVLFQDRIFEVTTFRRERGYSDGRHPDEVSYSSSVEEDLKRRDFTMNAMAWNPQQGLLDLFHGRSHLKEGRLVAVGNARERMEEDALRMLRAVRFAARFQLSMDEDLFLALRDQAPALARVSVERSLEELDRCFLGSSPSLAIELLEMSGLFAVLFPDLHPFSNPRFDRLPQQLDLRWASFVFFAEGGERAPSPGFPMLAKDEAALQAEQGKKLLRRFHSSRERQENLAFLLRSCGEPLPRSREEVLWWMNRYEGKWSLLFSWMQFFSPQQGHLLQRRVGDYVDQKLCYRLQDLQITGKDLLKIGYNRGKVLGETLQEMLRLVIQGKLQNERQELLAFGRERGRTNQGGTQ